MEEEDEEEGSEYYCAYFSSENSRARRFAPVFNITPWSRMFYPPFPLAITSSPLALPRSQCFSYESRGIAPRNEFTILIWRAALAIYYLHSVGEKTGMRCRSVVEGGQNADIGTRGE